MKKIHQQYVQLLLQKKPELNNSPVRNNPRPQKSSKARNIKEYQPSFEGKSYNMQFISISKKKQRECSDNCYRTAVRKCFAKMSAKQGIKKFK